MHKEAIQEYLTEKRPLSLQINDLSALLSGEKRVIYASIKNEEDRIRIMNLCEVFGFNIFQLKQTKDLLRKKSFDILIGTDLKRMKMAKHLYLNGKYCEWAIYLDYPECCVKELSKWDDEGKRESFIKHEWRRSEKDRPIKFYMNNVLNFYSRLWNDSLRKSHEGFLALNSDYIRSPMSVGMEPVICWHPCSYNCKTSLKKAENIYQFMVKHIPQIALARKEFLSKPVLFKNDFEWVILDGTTRFTGKKLETAYKNLLPVKSFTDKKILGNGPKKPRIVSKNGRILSPERLSKDFILIPFAL